MHRANVTKWLFLLGSGGLLFQTSPGCSLYPGQEAINAALSSGVQELINGVIGLYLEAGVNQWLHV